ncbi:hypothetical protein Patl1_26745 [Pistacia atlantica]|uniref:Uncharacterized protein n=1 Tax=Pistacia atlantica TaxID=434234 RepID=A0ACC1B558_9ROSI|nr:hypothetical protein Patl1_26745 [Pistacia atlantica]
MFSMENMVAENQKRAHGLASILAIGTANPPNIFYQDDYPDFYFGVTQSDHMTQLKDKFKRIYKYTSSPPFYEKFKILLGEKTMIRKRHMHLSEEITKEVPNMTTLKSQLAISQCSSRNPGN